MERATPSTSSKWGAILKSFGIYCRLYWQPTSFPVSAHYFFPKFYGKVKFWKKHHNLIIGNNFFSLKGTVYSSSLIEAKSKVEKHKQSIRLLIPVHRYKGQLCVDRRICCCSQFMIFLLELLGQAIGCLAGPSSSNRKIMN